MFPWEILYGLGAILLAAGLIWAMWENSKRTRSEKSISEAAAALSKKRPEKYDNVRNSLGEAAKGFGDLEKAEASWIEAHDAYEAARLQGA